MSANRPPESAALTPLPVPPPTPPLPDREPAWGHFVSEGWWPAAWLDAWPLWPELGAAASDVLHPIQSSWALLFACVPALCLMVDRFFGEPAARWHPVVWMGHYLGFWGKRLAPRCVAGSVSASQTTSGLGRVWLSGALAWWGGAVLVLLCAVAVQALVLSMPIWLALPALALALKPMLAWAMLHDEVLAVELALARSLDEGRQQLSRLVSRDTTQLSAVEVRESAIETLAENLCDSVVAPLFWFALLGLPGAALYRFANTADAMWGYKGERGGRDWTAFGHWTARTDDVLNWLPARLTAALLMLGARWGAWQQLRHEARKTPSPNGGWTMGAMALRLNVHLRKPSSYCLHEAGGEAAVAHTLQAARRASQVCVLSAVLLGLGVLGGLLWGGLWVR